ncbi:MAG: methyltransferase domain-containing protein [Rhizomicrobium sp.]
MSKAVVETKISPAIMDILRCPRCRSRLEQFADRTMLCTSDSCPCSFEAFPVAGGQPVLVDFERSIFDRSSYQDGRGSVLPRQEAGSFRRWIRGLSAGKNEIAPRIAPRLVERVKSASPRPLVLVIGGGTRGSGTEALYGDAAITVFGIDVYASPNTQVVADAHFLPVADGSCDAVWIQAVLEHVLEPNLVVQEIVRVLKPDGIVYADTPFMQQVHEGAYDFTRFTLSGHRWLFRGFEEIESGVVGGAGTASSWSLRYLLEALGIRGKLNTILTLPFFWLRFLDRFTDPRRDADAASSVYFFGKKTDTTLSPKAVVEFYNRRKTR